MTDASSGTSDAPQESGSTTADHAAVPGVAVPELLDAVQSDPHRKPFERESRVLWSAEGDDADVYTTQPSIMRRLLCHPEFSLRWFEARSPGESDHKTRSYHVDDSGGLAAWEGTEVYSLEGSLPLGCVLLKERARPHGTAANTVSEGVLANDPRERSNDA